MVTKLKHYNPRAGDLVADWRVIDASGRVLGRLASEIATLLMGKHRPTYVPHMLSGDFVVVINAAEVRVTGRKADQIVYKRHSGRPGNLKEIPYRRMQATFPERIIEHAVKGMLPKNKLGARMMRRLKVYAGTEHPHIAQLIGSERRPERDAAARVKAEEEAREAKQRKERAAARAEIEEQARAKAEVATEDAVDAVAEEAAPEEPGKKAPARRKSDTSAAKKPAAKKTAAGKTTAPKTKATAKKASATKKPAAKRTSTKPDSASARGASSRGAANTRPTRTPRKTGDR